MNELFIFLTSLLEELSDDESDCISTSTGAEEESFLSSCSNISGFCPLPEVAAVVVSVDDGFSVAADPDLAVGADDDSGLEDGGDVAASEETTSSCLVSLPESLMDEASAGPGKSHKAVVINSE